MDILLFFSNRLIAEGIRCILENEADINVRLACDAAALGDELRHDNPDILLVDFFVLENYLPSVLDKTKVLLLDTGCNEQQINHALIIKNVIGVIDMNTNVTMLKRALTAVSEGQIWIRRKTVNDLIGRLSNLIRICNLTATEMDIFKMLGDGLDDDEIARKLGTREITIKHQIETLKKKNKVNNKLELIDLSRYFSDFDTLTH